MEKWNYYKFCSYCYRMNEIRFIYVQFNLIYYGYNVIVSQISFMFLKNWNLGIAFNPYFHRLSFKRVLHIKLKPELRTEYVRLKNETNIYQFLDTNTSSQWFLISSHSRIKFSTIWRHWECKVQIKSNKLTQKIYYFFFTFQIQFHNGPTYNLKFNSLVIPEDFFFSELPNFDCHSLYTRTINVRTIIYSTRYIQIYVQN